MSDATPRKAAALERLRARTPGSAAMRPRAERRLALEAVPTFAMPVPLYIESGDGAYMTDVDGNAYLDLAMGFGSLILGHRPPEVVAAMHGQIDKGWHTILPGVAQIELAELLAEAVPCAEKVAFQNSGTEATMFAMRLARAFTGKDRVAVFGGGYHGTHDYALVQEDPTTPEAAPATKTVGGGIPGAVRDQTMLALPYRNAAAFDLIRKHRDELALVVIQPVQNTVPHLDNGAYLRELRAVCDGAGVLLMFDEVVTGFRLAYGGGQVYYGVTPDLAAFGKIIGGGTAVGAVCGRADILGLFAKGGTVGVFAGGTFNGNPLTMGAGAATLRALKARKDTLYPALAAKSARMAGAVIAHCEKREMDVTLMHAASIQCFHFRKGPIHSFRETYPANRAAEEAFYALVLDRGILLPSFHVYFLSAAHDDAMIDHATGAFIEALDDCRADGLL
ncbi:MAG: aminotransferase class III-fold pyridoxal phosphate-dependent enzyme [Sphingosinicella sp.]|nr:aminotransferase class III-fold pyridoxal phosphate-dependent enzyme [Sphingosinicella sp.]